MRTWLSFRTGIRGVRLGVALPTSRTYNISATGAKIWYTGSALMLAALAIWLIASRDQEGRLNEWWLLVTFMVLGFRYLFKLTAVALFPPIEAPPTK